jgi:Mg-chelatase subunit ChlD
MIVYDFYIIGSIVFPNKTNSPLLGNANTILPQMSDSAQPPATENLAPLASNQRVRWRLILGAESEGACGVGLEGIWHDRDQAIGFLYGRETADRNVRGGERFGGSEASQLTVPDWINAIHELFPQKTIERLEKDALERYHLEEMVTNPDLLRRAEPSPTLLKAVLRTKHLMNQEVLNLAKNLVRQVVEQLMEKLARQVQSPFMGSIDRRKRSFLKVAKNFDPQTTIRRNLSHYDPETRRLYIKTPYFFSRIRRQVDRWQIIILVDESGSMMDSVIHSAVTASIFFGIKSLRTHLCLFDTSIVDVTDYCTDPVETLMKVQLGGGTDIGNALSYGASLVDNPRRTIVILITDFYEGGPVSRLLSVARQLLESGVTLLGLAALDEQANPCYDRELARRLVNLGAHVGAMTPGELATWVAEKVR